MLFEKRIDGFIDHLRMRNFSERTIDLYTWAIKHFTDFLEKYYQRVDSLEKVTKDILLDYQKFIYNFKMESGQHYSKSTQCCRLKALRTFFKYLMKMDYVLHDPSTILTFPREEQRLVRNILSQKEMLEMINNVKPTSPVNIRNRAIIELFYSCGMRTSELCNLTLNDIDLKDFTITVVKGKGNKSRILPLGQYPAHYIELYLKGARKQLLKLKPDPDNLFITSSGNAFTRTSINKTVMQSVLKSIKTDKHISCYSIRHAVATHLLENKVDIAYIAELLGHASLRTTQRYLKIEISELKKVHSQFHPRERN